MYSGLSPLSEWIFAINWVPTKKHFTVLVVEVEAFSEDLLEDIIVGLPSYDLGVGCGEVKLGDDIAGVREEEFLRVRDIIFFVSEGKVLKVASGVESILV